MKTRTAHCACTHTSHDRMPTRSPPRLFQSVVTHHVTAFSAFCVCVCVSDRQTRLCDTCLLHSWLAAGKPPLSVIE